MEYDSRSVGKASIFRINIAPNSRIFRYDVNMKTEFRDLIRQTDGSLQVAEKQCCFAIMETVSQESGGFEVGLYTYAYDGRAILYTTKKIKPLRMTIRADKFVRSVWNYVRSNPVTIEITPNGALGQLDCSHFAPALRALDGTGFQPDRSIQSFIEVLTTHCLLRNNEYYCAAAGVLFETQPYDTKPGMQMLSGLQKGAKVVDAQTMYLVVDMTRSVFFSSSDRNGDPTDLQAELRKFRRDELFERHFQGVRMQPIYGERRTFVFGRLSDHPIGHPKYNIPETGESVKSYFQQKGIQIDGRLRGVHPEGRNNIVYPIECVRVFEGQQLPQDRTPKELENSIIPNQRYSFIMKHVQKLNERANAEYLQHFGVSIDLKSNNVQILHRKMPKIAIKNAAGKPTAITPQPNGSFFRDILGAQLWSTKQMQWKWIIARDPEVPRAAVEEYAKGLVARCAQAGMPIPLPALHLTATTDELETLFKKAKEDPNPKQRFQFILYVDSRRIPRSHDKLKLFEAGYKILTQQISWENLDLSKAQTIRNVILKLNSKMFGLNYHPIFDPSVEELDLARNPDLLVIGYDVAHPQRANAFEIGRMKNAGIEYKSTNPSVVGISSNKARTPFVFTADFFYQEPLQEKVECLKLSTAVVNVVRMKFAATKVLPKRLFVIRDGVSEGQYSMVMFEEYAAILEGWKQAVQTLDPKFHNQRPTITLIVASKRHHKRFFRIDGADFKNTQCGDLIVDKFVRTDVLHNFFLQSHHPLRGMPKPTEYVVLRDDHQLPREKIEKFMFLLASMHQVSACPTSLPLPVYQADEIAARGLEIYKELRRLMNEGCCPEFATDIREEYGILNFDQLTEILSYSKSSLSGTRFNA